MGKLATRAWFPILLAGRLALPLSADAQPSQERIRAAADSLLTGLHARGWFNGAVVLGREKELYAGGFGPANVQAGVAFTPDTPADGASVAKTFTAATVFMLVEDGRLDLDAPVRRYLPEYPHAQTRVRHLLTHSAGLPEADYDFFNDLIPPARIRTTTLLLAILREQGFRPAFEPGTRFRYSNLGFDVAALLVERISGKPWERFLRERVFGPLGMRSAFLRAARLANWPGVRTLSYRHAADSLIVNDVFDHEGFYGGSNLYFSARDLFRWSRSFYTRPVLSKATIRRGVGAAVLRDALDGSGGSSRINFLGWYYPAHGRRYHYPGSLQGFWSSVYRDEDQKYSIVYMSNNSMPQWLRPLLTRALIDIMEGRSPGRIDPPAYREIDAEHLGNFAGTYLVEGVGPVRIEARDKRAFIRAGKGIEYPAFFVGDGQLYVPGLDVWIGFPAGSPDPYRRLRWLSIFRVAEGERTSRGLRNGAARPNPRFCARIVPGLSEAMRSALDQFAATFEPFAPEEYNPELAAYSASRQNQLLYQARGDFNGDGLADLALNGHDKTRELLIVILSRPDSSYKVVPLKAIARQGSDSQTARTVALATDLV